MTEPTPQCEGICLTGADLGLPYGGIAYAHPDCPAHGDSWRPQDNQWSRDYIAQNPERFPPAEGVHPDDPEV